MMMRNLAMCAVLTLSACGSKSLYLIDRPVTAEKIRVSVATVEVKDVTLPAYAEASEIAVQGADGALTTIKGALWAEDPASAVTRAVAFNLDEVSTANVAAEPWPLADSPDAQIDLRIDRMLARADGQFELGGQFAITSPSGNGRERLQRFSILTPLADAAPGSVATATSRALLQLSTDIAQALR